MEKYTSAALAKVLTDLHRGAKYISSRDERYLLLLFKTFLMHRFPAVVGRALQHRMIRKNKVLSDNTSEPLGLTTSFGFSAGLF